MAKKLLVAVVAVAIIFSGCSKNEPENITVDSPSIEPVVTEEPTAAPTIQPTAEPTPRVEMFEYLNDIEPETPIDTVFMGEWTFRGEQVPITMNGKEYENGVGMYVASADIMGERGSINPQWNFDKTYHKITFDIGCEQSNQYGNETKYGKYKIDILVNGAQVWTSEYHDYTYVHQNVELNLTNEECEILTIKLTQYKGTNGTLNVVLGDFKLYYYSE